LVYLSGPLIATLIRYTTGGIISTTIIHTTIANIITTIIRTDTGTGATTVIGTTTMMLSKPKRFAVAQQFHLQTGFVPTASAATKQSRSKTARCRVVDSSSLPTCHGLLDIAVAGCHNPDVNVRLVQRLIAGPVVAMVNANRQ
jgi:hypothetical protein